MGANPQWRRHCALRRHRGFRPADPQLHFKSTRTGTPSVPGLEDSERGVAEGSGDRDRSGGEPAGPRRHFSLQYRRISCGFGAGSGHLSQGNGTPTRFNDRDRIPTSRPLRAGGRARGLALDHADGLGRCPVVEISRLAPADRAVRLPESTDSCPSRPALRTGGERERADFGGRRRLRERPGGSSSDHPAAVRLPSRSPLRPRPSPSRASRSRRPVRRPPGRRVICVTAPTKKMCLIQLMRPT
jgi:hypothetical protein